MRTKRWPAAGEIGLALLFAAIGAVWVVVGADLPLWEGFAPQTGFLPLIYGAALLVLSGAIIVSLVLEGDTQSEERDPLGKPLLVLAAVAAAVIGLNAAGFAIAIFLLMLFLFAAVERLPILASVLVSGLTTGALVLLFRGWLGVPLPVGPWGF
jgi:hypothetical protein